MARFEIFHQDTIAIVINVDDILYIRPHDREGEHTAITYNSGEVMVVDESFNKVSKMIVQPSKIF